MSNKNKITLLAVVLLFALCAPYAFGMGSKRAENLNTKDKTKRDIVINHDMASMLGGVLKHHQTTGADKELLKKMLEDIIDEHAKAEVNTVVWIMFQRFQTDTPVPLTHTSTFDHLPKLREAGLDFRKILLDRSHERGIRYIAGLRMNDRHGDLGTPPECCNMGKFMKDNPQWLLKGVPPHRPGLDYAYDEVRDAMLTVIAEILENYDVDGLELDYMRWCHMFEPGQGSKYTDVLTGFNRKIRKLLDDAAKRRGRKRLALGVRVPQSLDGCAYLGFDIETWIQDGIVDWVVPIDFYYTDFNIKVEDYVKLTEGTDCKIYVGIHPAVAWGVEYPHMTPANYRAAAKNYYAAGADGLSPFNYMLCWDQRRNIYDDPLRPSYMWPAALGNLRQLRYIDQINANDRHYMFYPIWNMKTEWLPPSGFYIDNSIYLDRSSKLQGSQSFRMAEDFSDPDLHTVMQFKAVGLVEAENLEVHINGVKVPRGYLSRIFRKQGLTKADGRADSKILPAFYYYWIDMNWGKAPIINGDNKLTVRLIPTDDKREGEVHIDELEVYVYVRK